MAAWSITPDELQRDLDRFLEFYNLKRNQQDCRLQGRTPAQALCDAIGRKKLPTMIPKASTSEEKLAA